MNYAPSGPVAPPPARHERGGPEGERGGREPLQVALIDVGGTLWPNSWPLRETDGDGRHRRVAAALTGLSSAAVDALVTDLIRSSRIGDEARSINTEHTVKVPPAELLVAASLQRQG